MSARKAKLVTAVRVEANTSMWLTAQDGVDFITNVEVVIPAGVYYIVNDGTATDLCDTIVDAITAAGYAGVAFSLSSTGIVSLTYTGSTSLKIHWGDPDATGRSAQYVQAWFRHEGYGEEYVINSTPTAGARCHVGGFYPTHYLITDRFNHTPLANMLVPDQGNAQVIYVSTRKRYDIEVRTEGYPRAAGFNESHDLEAWWQHAIQGLPTRLYPDVTVATAYTTSSRYGYQVMLVVPGDFDPPPESATWYRYHTFRFDAVEHTD